MHIDVRSEDYKMVPKFTLEHDREAQLAQPVITKAVE